MSVSSISSSNSLSQSLQTWQAKTQKIQSEFQQLGQDLQAGNLSQANTDFTALSQNASGSIQNNSTLSQAFSSLGSALQSGNLPAAQKAYSTIQQDVQQAGQTGASGGHYHHRSGTQAQTPTTSLGSTLSQLLGSLGSALQSGSLSTAQTAYSSLTQDLQQVTLGASGAAQIASQAFSLMG